MMNVTTKLAFFFSVVVIDNDMNSQTEFYPAAPFPEQGQTVQYDITGTMYVDTTPFAPVVAPLPTAAPQAMPAVAAFGYCPPIPIPVATPAPYIAPSVLPTTSEIPTTVATNTTSGGGVVSISAGEAIVINEERMQEHPDVTAISTSTPSVALPTIRQAPTTASAPPVLSETITTMAETLPPQYIAVSDTITSADLLNSPPGEFL